MAVVVNNPGIIAANYANLRHRFLADQFRSQVLVQDFIKLYRKILNLTHDQEQSVEIVKNTMMSFNFQKDDVGALVKMSKWSEGALQFACELFEHYETYQSLDSDSLRKSNLQKSGRRLSVPKLSFHRISKVEEGDLMELGRDVLDRKMKLSELSEWSLKKTKLVKIKEQVMDISRAFTGENIESYDDLSQEFDDFNDEALMKFSKATLGEGFKTGDRVRLEKFVANAIRQETPENDDMASFENIEDISSDKLAKADLIILNSKSHTDTSISTFLDKKTGLIIVCPSQSMFHNVLRTVFNSPFQNQSDQIVTVIAGRDDDDVVIEDGTEGGLTFLVLAGKFDIINPNLKTSFYNLQSALSEMVAAVTPEVNILLLNLI